MQHIEVQVDIYILLVCWSVLEATIRPPTKYRHWFCYIDSVTGRHALLSVKQDAVEINTNILAIEIIPSAF